MLVNMDKSRNTEWKMWTTEVYMLDTSTSLRLGQVGPLSQVPLSRSPCTLAHLPWNSLLPQPVPGTNWMGPAALCTGGLVLGQRPAWTSLFTDLCPAHRGDRKSWRALRCAFPCQARFQERLSADCSRWLVQVFFRGVEQDWAVSMVRTHHFGPLRLMM